MAMSTPIKDVIFKAGELKAEAPANDTDAANKRYVDGGLKAKVNTSDIINNLTTDDANKPLSAAQGKALNDSLSGFRNPLNSEADYKKVVNSKRWSLINLSGLISIENTFGVTQGDLQQLIRTNERSQNFYFNNDPIAGKYFRFNYAYTVWMKSLRGCRQIIHHIIMALNCTAARNELAFFA